jgi:membrane protease YdiL (CAAX protease family)
MPDNKDEPLPGRTWREVDPRIWSPGPPTKMHTRILRRVYSIFATVSLWTLIIFGPLTVLLTIAGTDALVGPSLFGPAMILVWSGLIAGFVLVVERSGYARNFETWSFNFTKERLLAAGLIFGVLLTIFFIFTFVLNKP